MSLLPMIRRTSDLEFLKDPILNEFDSLFNEFFNSFIPSKGQFTTLGKTYPKCDVMQTKDNYKMVMEIVGLDKKDLEVFYNESNETLIVKGNRKQTHRQEQGIYIMKQLKTSSFKRNFFIPKQLIKMDEITVKFNEGLLTIIIPKTCEQLEQKKSVFKFDIE